MKINHVGASQCVTSQWSGGTTTQLFIFPETASYQNRDFLFRISSAKVEIAESIFTKLPGVSRKIMILAGELKLKHENNHTKILKKFETDSFSGDWNTVCRQTKLNFSLRSVFNSNSKLNYFFYC